MTDHEILKMWIERGEQIAFWGASERALQLMSAILQQYHILNPVCIFDNYSKESKIIINEKQVDVKRPFNDNENQNLKIILCIDSKESYAEVREQLHGLGKHHGTNYIDGYECCRVLFVKGLSGHIYEVIRNCVTYAPWRECENDSFLQYYEKIRNNTLVDIYRCYEIWEMVHQTSKLGKGELLEVGVYKGGVLGH